MTITCFGITKLFYYKELKELLIIKQINDSNLNDLINLIDLE